MRTSLLWLHRKFHPEQMMWFHNITSKFSIWDSKSLSVLPNVTISWRTQYFVYKYKNRDGLGKHSLLVWVTDNSRKECTHGLVSYTLLIYGDINLSNVPFVPVCYSLYCTPRNLLKLPTIPLGVKTMDGWILEPNVLFCHRNNRWLVLQHWISILWSR